MTAENTTIRTLRRVRWAALTGSSEQITAAAKAYRVYYAPAGHEQSGADVVSHSAGQFDALLPSDIDAEKLAACARRNREIPSVGGKAGSLAEILDECDSSPDWATSLGISTKRGFAIWCRRCSFSG